MHHGKRNGREIHLAAETDHFLTGRVRYDERVERSAEALLEPHRDLVL